MNKRKKYNESLAQMDAWQATRWMRLLDWIEERTTGKHSWPWGMIWLWKGFAFHFASGSSGFSVTIPLPRWLPGHVRSYQVDGPKRFWQKCPWWRDSDLHMNVGLYPPCFPSTYRTRRIRKRYDKTLRQTS